MFREQAIWGGLAAGAAEMLFEKVGIENLLKPKSGSGVKFWLKEIFKQGTIEASEEMLTEIANILSDAAIMGQNSNWANAVASYQRLGLSAEQAKQRAFLDNRTHGDGSFVQGSTEEPSLCVQRYSQISMKVL